MLPMRVSGLVSPEMAAPFRHGAGARVFAFLVKGSEIEIAVLGLNDLGVQLDLAFALAIDASLLEFADHIAMVDHVSRLGCIFEQMPRTAGIAIGRADPDMSGSVAPGAAPDR